MPVNTFISHLDGRDYLDTEPDAYDDWSFRHTTWRGGQIKAVGARHPERDLFESLAQGHPVWETRTVCSKSGMRLRETRKGRIEEFRECRDGEYLALVDFGRDLARVDARELLVDIAVGGQKWRADAPADMDFDQRRMTQWVDIREQAEMPEPDSVSDLTFEKIGGRGSRRTVNSFLEGHEDGFVDHACGGVHTWKAAFVARYEGEIIAALVLAPHPNGKIAAEGEEVVISRIACHPVRPKNTSSWMISKARKWAERDGFERISALAGVDGNRGKVYEAAGFELEDVNEDYLDRDGNKWHKRRYVDELNPEKYAGRDVPMPGVDASA